MVIMIENLYFPSQPDLVRMSAYYKELRTSKFTDIAVYYEFKVGKKIENVMCLIPDGCFDLLFCLDENKPQVYLWTTPYSKKEQSFIRPEGLYFGVRFWPEQTSLFFREHMHDLIEQVIPLQYLLSFNTTIFEKMINADTFQYRIKIFDDFFLSIKEEAVKESMIVKHVIHQLYETSGQCSLKAVAQSVGFSQQYIRRIFERFIGLSPKQLAQVVQLQRILQAFEMQQQVDLQDIAFNGGYYDQAHFIKNFKKFMHTTPKKYLMKTMPFNDRL